MNKRVVFWIKVVVFLVIVVVVAVKLHDAWLGVKDKHIPTDWRWGGIALVGFAGSMLTAATVWRWLARKMGDRSPTLPLLASYTYSQMGKYFPGKVFLLFMRIERASRFGMTPAVCTLSTLLENALYMISGALVGMLAIVRITGEVAPKYRPFVWPLTIAIITILITVCVPPVFYGLVNRLLRKMKKPEVPASDQLGAAKLAWAVVAFSPCWFFGGLAMWASARCVHDVSLLDSWWFAGAFALSVIFGMASFLPGGAIIREAALGAAAALQFSALGVAQDKAALLGAAVAILQRIFQLIVEILLGLIGMALTARPLRHLGQA